MSAGSFCFRFPPKERPFSRGYVFNVETWLLKIQIRMLEFGGLETINMRSLWSSNSLFHSGVALGATLLVLAALVYAAFALGGDGTTPLLHEVVPVPSDSGSSQPWLVLSASLAAIVLGLLVTILASVLSKNPTSRPPQ